MAVVSNSSPLIIFSKGRRLSLLQQVFDEVLIPEAVFEEVVTEGAGRPGSADIAGMAWIKVHAVTSPVVTEGWVRKPGRGELEAIALATEMGGGVALLIDDRLGRKIAQELGLSVIGSAGVLLYAKELGLIPLVGPVLEELRSVGLYLSTAANHEALAIAGELPASEAEGT